MDNNDGAVKINLKKWLYIGMSVLAFFIVAASIWHVSSREQDYSECAQSAEIAALNQIEFDTTIDAEPEPENKKYNDTYIQNRIDCSDLKAQWAMSKLALLGYVAGLIGLIFLGVTVFETQGAARSASDTLKIARETLSAAKTNSKRELRAYLKTEVDIYNIYNTIRERQYGEPTPVKFCVGIENCGSTPAKDVRTSFTVYRGSRTYLDEPNWTRYEDENKGLLVSPNQEVLLEYNTRDDVLGGILREKLKGKTPTLFEETDHIMAKTVVSFSDIFGNRHTHVSLFGIPYSSLEKAPKTDTVGIKDKNGRTVRKERIPNLYYVERSEMLLMKSDERTENTQES